MDVVSFFSLSEPLIYADLADLADELADNAVAALGDNLAVFIANHGNVGCGGSLDQAWTVCQQVEMAAKIQFKASLLGTIYAIPEEAEEAEKEIYDIMKDMGI